MSAHIKKTAHGGCPHDCPDTCGIVVATLGYWRQLNTGTVNCISSAEFVDMGHGPTYSDNLVQIELAG